MDEQYAQWKKCYAKWKKSNIKDTLYFHLCEILEKPKLQCQEVFFCDWGLGKENWLEKRCGETFWGDRGVLNLKCCSGYTTVYNFQDS